MKYVKLFTVTTLQETGSVSRRHTKQRPQSLQTSLLKAVLAGVLATAAPLATAEIITDIWHANITSVVNTSAFSVGDSVSWTVTYDDASTSSHYYGDGTDGMAGTADDTLLGAINVSGTYSFSADTVTDISSIVSQMVAGIADFNSFYDFNSINYDRLYTQATNGRMYNDLVHDHITFFARSDGASTNYLSLHYNPVGLNNYKSSVISFGNYTIERNVSLPTNDGDVPEPSDLSLLMAGLAGLSTVRRRKKNNSL